MQLGLTDLRKVIPSARKKIVDLFVDQCLHGAQIQNLPEQARACGQFLGPNAKSLRQRGMYGTAAALRVLSDTDDPRAQALVPKLVYYIQNRSHIEDAIDHKDHSTTAAKLELDQENVLKLSELVYALSFVKHSIAQTDEVKTRLVSQLKQGLIEDRGWGYFIGDQEPELIPTAYAIRALGSLGYDISAPSEYLLESVRRSNEEGATRDTDIMTYVLIIFTLTFSGGEVTRREELRNLFDSLWRPLEPLLHHDLEQNTEYWHESDNMYVRIPWQLYLLSLAAKLRPLRRLGSKAAQERMRSIIDSVTGTGFLYPHSGKMLSSRTNAIVYETLGILADGLNHPILFSPSYALDRTRNALSTRTATVSTGLVAASLAAYSVIRWLEGEFRFSELGPHAAWGLLVAAMTMRKSR